MFHASTKSPQKRTVPRAAIGKSHFELQDKARRQFRCVNLHGDMQILGLQETVQETVQVRLDTGKPPTAIQPLHSSDSVAHSSPRLFSLYPAFRGKTPQDDFHPGTDRSRSDLDSNHDSHICGHSDGIERFWHGSVERVGEEKEEHASFGERLYSGHREGSSPAVSFTGGTMSCGSRF